jgi:microcystin-dependent protein
MARALVSKSSITGEVKAYAGSTAPEGYLLCQGQTVSRTTYSALFDILGTSHGQGDGLTTFNLPDYRGTFLRGRVNITTIIGSGTVPITPNNTQATFSNHGINRTGFKIRLSSGTLGGLAISTDYYAIVVNSNTLAFATTLANALAGTRIALTSGSVNSAVIVQFEDPDYASRTAATVGGNSAGGLGSIQGDQFGSHTHVQNDADAGIGNQVSVAGQGATVAGVKNSGLSNLTAKQVLTDITGGTESRPKNSLINYIIKY